MLQKESAHNIFRLLMCRDLNLHQLKGVIFDHSCGLDQYLLNREPREFEYLRCLVDGSHWSSQKRLRKPDRSGKGGHLGCSSGFNYNLYKPYLPNQTNSQGREQMHAILDKLVPSLRQMSYPVFMTMMRGKMQFLMIIYVLCNSYAMFSFKLFMKIASFLVFFGIRNLTKKGET
jgi:hypothetical protein